MSLSGMVVSRRSVSTTFTSSLIKLTLVCAVLLAHCLPTASDEHAHTYEDNEEVVLWMNTVGPYHNRQETYSYFSLPFCPGKKKDIAHYHETLGEALQGVELEFSGLEINYKCKLFA